MPRTVGRATTALVMTSAVLAMLLGACSGDDSPSSNASTPAASTPAATSGTSADTTPSPSDTGGTTSTDEARSSVGGLVPGFPTDLIPVLPGATITLSTDTEAGGLRQVSLAGTSTTPADQILAFYRDALVSRGFTEAPTPVPAGVLASSFTRNQAADLLSVSVSTTGGLQVFTVGGQVAAG